MHEDPRAEKAILSSAEAYRLVEEARQMRAERDAHAAQIQGLRAENDLLGNALHTLVCNAYGYDKSIVRALALQANQWAQHRVIDSPDVAALAQRVLAAETVASRVSHCSDFHAEGEG